MKEFNVAPIPGDGIGKEVVPAGREALDPVAAVYGSCNHAGAGETA